MGDNGKMYVPETLLPIYRDEIIPLADICTPNQYEMELLTGNGNIDTKEETLKSLNWFHERGVTTVALSSTSLGTPDQLLAFLSHRKGAHILSFSKLNVLIRATKTFQITNSNCVHCRYRSRAMELILPVLVICLHRYF